MKKLSAALLAALLAVSTFSASADTDRAALAGHVADTLALQLVDRLDQETMNLIDWKVGDSMAYVINGPFGQMGSMEKSVASDEGEALWIDQKVQLLGQNEEVKMLLRKSDGKVLKIIRNGQEQDIPDEKVEIISQEYEDITVPAGTFQSIHIVAKTEQVERLDVWVNMRDVVMDGTLKQIVPTSFMTLTFELTGFNRGQ